MSPVHFGLSPAMCVEARRLFGEEAGHPVYCAECGIDLATNPDIKPLVDFTGKGVFFPCNCGHLSCTRIFVPREWLEERGLLLPTPVKQAP